MSLVQHLLALSGVGSDRLRLRWVSAAEGLLFAQNIKEYSDDVRALGPFQPEDYEMALSALERVLASSRLRWLIGMEVKITEKGNVYGEVLEEEDYRRVLRETAQAEYEKCLILEAMKQGSHTVRDLAMDTGLAVHDVSCRLNELERSHQAEFSGYHGKTPMFAALV
jgi:hypothetical protein